MLKLLQKVCTATHYSGSNKIYNPQLNLKQRESSLFFQNHFPQTVCILISPVTQAGENRNQRFTEFG